MSALFRPHEVGVDLGTTTVRVYVKGKGIVLREPSVVALEKATGEVRAVGEDAYRLLGRDPGNIVTVRPLRDGVIADYPLTHKLLYAFLRRAVTGPNRVLGQNVMICVPSGVTDADRRNVLQAVREAGTKRAQLIEKSLAAALGAGLPVTEPTGALVVDVGGGTTDVAVVSLGGVVVAESLRLAGNEFDEAIVRFVRQQQNVLIGDRTAEEIKLRVGAASVRADDAEVSSFEVRGRDITSGILKDVTVTRSDVAQALRESLEKIAAGVQRVLEAAPPELVANIIDTGMVLTGGSATTADLVKLLQQTTGVRARVAENAADATVLGIGKALAEPEPLELIPEQAG